MPIYSALGRYVLELRIRQAALAGIVVNLVSHPLGFLAIGPALSGALGDTGAVAMVELWAWVSEAMLLWAGLRRQGLELVLISLSANGTSFAVGVALSAVLR